jgi:hypothetical protein
LRYDKRLCPTTVAALFGGGNPFAESALDSDSKFSKTLKDTVTCLDEPRNVPDQPTEPHEFRITHPFRLWALDNECYLRPFDNERWLAHWHRLFPYSKRCLFVLLPDKPFDARETLVPQAPPAARPLR